MKTLSSWLDSLTLDVAILDGTFCWRFAQTMFHFLWKGLIVALLLVVLNRTLARSTQARYAIPSRVSDASPKESHEEDDHVEPASEDEKPEAETRVPDPVEPTNHAVSPNDAPLWERSIGTTSQQAAAGDAPPKSLDWYHTTEPIALDNHRLLVGETILDIHTGMTLKRLDLKTKDFNPSYLRLSGNHKYLLVYGGHVPPKNVLLRPSCVVKVWDLETGKQKGKSVWSANVFSPRSEFADVTPDGKTVVVGARGQVSWWDVSTGARTDAPFKPRRLDALALSPDGEWLVISDMNIITCWKWRTDEEPTKISVGRKIDSLRFSPDGRYLAEGPDSRLNIQVRDMQTLKIVNALEVEIRSPLSVLGMALTRGGKTLIAGNAITVDETKLKIPHRIHIWDVANLGCRLRKSRAPVCHTQLSSARVRCDA